MDQNYGMRPRSARDFRQLAWQALKGVWGIAIVVALVASLLGGGGFSFNVNINVNGMDSATPEMYEQFREIITSPAFTAFAAIGGLLSVVTFIIGGPIKVGYARFCLKLADGARPLEFKDLFSGFDVFGEAFLLNLRIILRVFGWSLLFVIPGIVAAYRYSQAFYVMAEHPELDSGACIERSKAMMDGNKWRLFCLQLSFIGWWFLTCLTLGILGLWVAPYMAVAETFFYRDVDRAAPASDGFQPGPDGYYYSQQQPPQQSADDQPWWN